MKIDLVVQVIDHPEMIKVTDMTRLVYYLGANPLANYQLPANFRIASSNFWGAKKLNVGINNG